MFHTISLSKDNAAARRRLRRRITNTLRKPTTLPTKLAKESEVVSISSKVYPIFSIISRLCVPAGTPANRYWGVVLENLTGWANCCALLPSDSHAAAKRPFVGNPRCFFAEKFCYTFSYNAHCSGGMSLSRFLASSGETASHEPSGR